MKQTADYKKHNIEVILFGSETVFTTAWFGSDIDGDAEDEFGIKPDFSDI